MKHMKSYYHSSMPERGTYSVEMRKGTYDVEMRNGFTDLKFDGFDFSLSDMEVTTFKYCRLSKSVLIFLNTRKTKILPW